MFLDFARLGACLRRPRACHLLAGCGLAVGLVLAAGTGVLVTKSYRNDVRDATRELQNLSFVLAEETDRGFAAAEVVQTDLIGAMRRRGIDSPAAFDRVMGTEAVHDELKRRIAGLQHVTALTLIGRDGRVVNISRVWPLPDIDASDRDFFRAIIKDPAQPPCISAPIRSRANGAWTILFARAFTAPNGQLLGIVTIAMELDSFETLFAQLSISRGSSVALWRSDGVLLARYPHQAVSIGKDYGAEQEFRRIMAARDHAVLLHASLIDGQQRLVVPHSVAHFPLMLAVSETRRAVLRESRALIVWVVGGAVLTEIVLAAIVLMGVRQLRGQERLGAAYAAALAAEAGRTIAESELDRARERAQRDRAARLDAMRFDTALGNMLQGLVMFDGDRRLLVVNARFSALIGLPENAIHAGMDYAAFTNAITEQGNIPPEDVATIFARRREMVEEHARAGVVWELSDGRSISVTHQPMEDGWLATYEDISERRRADERLDYLARHDMLTGLPNRTLFQERLEQALGFARHGRMVALLCLDLDQFKIVNDTLGPTIGDALLQAVAQRLADRVRDIDTFARLGGDEFAIVQTAIDKPDDATGLADGLIAALEKPFDVAGHHIAIGTSIGIAFAPQDAVDADVMLKSADLALYRAKMAGRRTWRLFQAEMEMELKARHIMEIELRAALKAGQFELFYQPLIKVSARGAGGFEALLRWHHPTQGLVSPVRFIPLAEETGLIVPIGEWALRRACAAAVAWPAGMRVSVNLSPVQFKDRGIVAAVVDALRASGLAAERLELEITESTMMADTDATVATLHEFRALGVHIAMDDFGTGYSSLSYLRKFPFDRIKIDQSFVRELGKQRDCAAIVRAVITLSRELGMVTTAEGVETNEQLRMLVMAGCTDLQGYLFSPPVPEQEIPGLLEVLAVVTEQMPPAALVA